jgi:DNA-binding response OmpR family regulator
MTTLALIEDNNDLRNFTEIYLKRHGFEVHSYADAEDFLASTKKIDIFVIDINLPEMSGFELVERLRAADPAACLVILSARERKADIVKGYNLGADVYLTKPVAPEILIAAIERLDARVTARKPNEVFVEVGANKIVYGANSQPLSSSEATLLHRLAIASARGLERHEIAECLGFDLDTYNSKALELRLLRLRRKIKAVGLEANQIETIRGFGYRLSNDVHFTFV